MSNDTVFLRRCIQTLELALDTIGKQKEADADLYDICRAACVKEFELVLEQSGKLLRKRIAAYFSSNRQADLLAFKDLFRYAAKHGLIEPEVVERWLYYREILPDELADKFDSIRVHVKQTDRQLGPYPYCGVSGIVDNIDDYLVNEVCLLIAENSESRHTQNSPIAFLADVRFGTATKESPIP